MPTYGTDGGGFHSSPDYRGLVDRLGFGRTMARNVTFSPDECWILHEHIRWLNEQAERCRDLSPFGGGLLAASTTEEDDE